MKFDWQLVMNKKFTELKYLKVEFATKWKKVGHCRSVGVTYFVTLDSLILIVGVYMYFIQIIIPIETYFLMPTFSIGMLIKSKHGTNW